MKQDYVGGCKCIRAWGGQKGVHCSQLSLKLRWKEDWSNYAATQVHTYLKDKIGGLELYRVIYYSVINVYY